MGVLARYGIVTALVTFLGAGTAVAQDDPVQTFIRGDVAVDGNVDLLDVFDCLGYFFSGDEPGVDCEAAYDFNDTGALDVADPIFLLGYVFLDGAEPPAPFPRCGHDTTDDDLTCDAYEACPEVTPTDLDEAAHVLRRVAYGQTPDLLDHVMEIGALNYISEQLDFEDIDESGNDAMNDLLDDLEPETVLRDLVRMQAARGIFSERQLVEVLTDFWENHFNTYWPTLAMFFRNIRFDGPGGTLYTPQEAAALATNFEWQENEAFRANSLGNFLDLLEISATSVSMLVYLDNISNIVGNPNENYARELLELHTMGVDNGYTQQDIEEVARVFTGWRICMVEPEDVADSDAQCRALVNADSNVWAFNFADIAHDDEEKVIFADTSNEITLGDDESGVDEGFALLEHLATLPQTAEYVSTKLVEKFVNDEAPLPLVADCLTVWTDTDGDLREVMETILTSDEFFASENRLQKVRTPMEFMFSTIRAFDGTVDRRMQQILVSMEQMPHFPFFFETPDGFPEKGDDQIGTQKLRNLIAFNETIYVRGDDVDFLTVVDVMEDHDVDLEDAEEIVTFWLDRLFGSDYDDTDRDLAIDFLETNVAGTTVELDSEADNYEIRILTLLGFIADYPQHLEQ